MKPFKRFGPGADLSCVAKVSQVRKMFGSGCTVNRNNQGQTATLRPIGPVRRMSFGQWLNYKFGRRLKDSCGANLSSILDELEDAPLS